MHSCCKLSETPALSPTPGPEWNALDLKLGLIWNFHRMEWGWFEDRERRKEGMNEEKEVAMFGERDSMCEREKASEG